MKCQNCGKQEATVRYTENVNGNKKEMHLCYHCAKKLGFADFTNLFSPMFVEMPDLLNTKELSCLECGYTFDDYAKSGLFGCPDCYDIFQDRLDDLFLKTQGKNRHVELRRRIQPTSVVEPERKEVKPKRVRKTKEQKIEELKTKIQKLIQEENYEEAAKVRDQIKELEGK